MSAPLQQQKLSFHLSGRVEAKRPGPKPKPATSLTPKAQASLHGARNRRKVGGVNEAEVIKAFREAREEYDAGEPPSDHYDSDDSDTIPYRKKTRVQYSREKKLQCITYFELTDMPGTGKEKGLWVKITAAEASKKLGIDQKQV